MNLPVLMPEVPDQKYACHSCGACCRDLVVHLTVVDRRKIDEQNWASTLGVEPYVEMNGAMVLNHASNGACVFLDDAGRCRIHSVYGLEAKPLACQIYPFTFETLAGNHRVGLRFDCPSTARNVGKPLSEHRSEVTPVVRQLAEVMGTQAKNEGPVGDLAPGLAMSPRESEAVTHHLDRWMKASAAPIVDRLCGLADLADTLESATLKTVRDERFDDLLGLLVDELPTVVREMRESPLPAPTSRQQRLLRQLAFSHAEHATFEDMQLSLGGRLGHRWRQFTRGRRMSGGSGSVPELAGRPSRTTFDAIRAVMLAYPDAAGAVDSLLTRYMRGRVLSFSICGPGHLDHDLISGLRATVLAVVSAAWFARWSAASAGRPAATLEDWVTAIGIVDRTATRSPALRGTAARLRLNYLAAEQGIARLLRFWLRDAAERGAA